MNCREFKTYFNVLLDENKYDEGDVIEHPHLPGCSQCKRYVESVLIIHRQLQSLREEPVPQTLQVRLRSIGSQEARRSILIEWKPEFKKAIPLMFIPAAGLFAGIPAPDIIKLILELIVVCTGLNIAAISILRKRIIG